jgi:hypothetical protein
MEPNEVIGDRYELGEPIGRGGMATIFRATDLRMGRLVAIKVLREVYSSDPKFVTRFQREARAASALQHPNIVQVFDYGQSGESYYIVMEYVEGADLRRYLKRHGVLSNERAVEIAHDVALGLGAAHRRGIVHRDVKPQNILLNDDGLVKLTDFGIASMYKDAGDERLTTTGMTLGTVQYYAPEQAQGEIVSPAADIYALGIVMYEMLTGRTPFDGDTPVAVAMRHIQDPPDPPSRMNPNIAPGLERIILRCLEKDPRDRYRDGDALAYALENYTRTPPRRYGSSGPGARAQFVPPLGAAGSNAWGQSGQTGRPPQFGTSAVISGPRGAGAAPPTAGGRMGGENGGMYDAPTIEDFEGPMGVGTDPYGPAGGTVPRISGPNGVPGPDDGGRRNGPLVATIVGATVLLLGLSCFLLLTVTNAWGGIGGLFTAQATATPPMTTVPSFVNTQYTAAQALAVQNHLQVDKVDKADQATPGTVLEQNVPQGSSVRWNTTITLTVSTGPGTVTVPDVTNKDVATACSTLNDSQYNLKCHEGGHEYSDTVPRGFVTRTDPPAGATAKPGDTVNYWISNGPRPTPTVPPPTATPTTAAPTATPTNTPMP